MIFFLLSMTLPYKSYYTPFFDTDFVSGIGGGLVLSFGVRGMLAFPKSPFVLVIFNILIYSFSWGHSEKGRASCYERVAQIELHIELQRLPKPSTYKPFTRVVIRLLSTQ